MSEFHFVARHVFDAFLSRQKTWSESGTEQIVEDLEKIRDGAKTALKELSERQRSGLAENAALLIGEFLERLPGVIDGAIVALTDPSNELSNPRDAFLLGYNISAAMQRIGEFTDYFDVISKQLKATEDRRLGQINSSEKRRNAISLRVTRYNELISMGVEHEEAINTIVEEFDVDERTVYRNLKSHNARQ